jgi:hypothetical protein
MAKNRKGMDAMTTTDEEFMKIAAPVLSEFGFSGVKELVAEQLLLMIQAKMDHFDAEDRLYASRFGQSYEEMVASQRRTGSENFEMDDVLNDWRFAKEAAALYRAKMAELEDA